MIIIIIFSLIKKIPVQGVAIFFCGKKNSFDRFSFLGKINLRMVSLLLLTVLLRIFFKY